MYVCIAFVVNGCYFFGGGILMIWSDVSTVCSYCTTEDTTLTTGE